MGGIRTSSITLPIFLPLLLLLLLSSPAKCSKRWQPCMSLVLYYHDILFNGTNAKNATSAIVAAPARANLTTLADFHHFGDVVVFDDPLTLDDNLHSTPVGRAQGFYLYDTKNAFTGWFACSFVFNSKDYQGTINLMGADPAAYKTRDLSVVGGTGDFFMTRGIATLMPDAVEDDVYFRLRVEVKLYECYHDE